MAGADPGTRLVVSVSVVLLRVLGGVSAGVTFILASPGVEDILPPLWRILLGAFGAGLAYFLIGHTAGAAPASDESKNKGQGGFAGVGALWVLVALVALVVLLLHGCSLLASRASSPVEPVVDCPAGTACGSLLRAPAPPSDECQSIDDRFVGFTAAASAASAIGAGAAALSTTWPDNRDASIALPIVGGAMGVAALVFGLLAGLEAQRFEAWCGELPPMSGGN